MKQKEKSAYKMRTSVKHFDSAYLKMFPMEKEEIKLKQDNPIEQTDETIDDNEQIPAYSTQRIRDKRYYDNNKENILKTQ